MRKILLKRPPSLLSETEMHFLPVPEPQIEELIKAGYIEIDPDTGNEQRLRKYLTAKEWAHYLGLQTPYEVPVHTSEFQHECIRAV